MAKQSLTLESLERIVAADDDRRLAMAALAGLREVAAGDHYSAMWFDATNCKIADYFLDQSWLAADHTFWKIAQRGLAESSKTMKLTRCGATTGCWRAWLHSNRAPRAQHASLRWLPVSSIPW